MTDEYRRYVMEDCADDEPEAHQRDRYRCRALGCQQTGTLPGDGYGERYCAKHAGYGR